MTRRRKMGNKPTQIDGIKFASLLEAKRYSELRLLVSAGRISDLKLQPRFQVLPTLRHDAAADLLRGRLLLRRGRPKHRRGGQGLRDRRLAAEDAAVSAELPRVDPASDQVMAKNSGIPFCDSVVNPTMGCDGCELWNSSTGGSRYAAALPGTVGKGLLA